MDIVIRTSQDQHRTGTWGGPEPGAKAGQDQRKDRSGARQGRTTGPCRGRIKGPAEASCHQSPGVHQREPKQRGSVEAAIQSKPASIEGGTV